MIEQLEILRRRDMRDAFTFTIDPADAKDFDDAISFERLPVTDEGLPETYQIGVHIADVSFYVRPGTKVDDEETVHVGRFYDGFRRARDQI